MVCPDCGGKKVAKCPQCKGKGTRTFIDWGGGRAAGKGGAAAMSKTEQCITCRGTGWLDTACPKCRGNGYVLCPLCEGKKEVPEEKAEKHKKEQMLGCGCLLLIALIIFIFLLVAGSQ